jgi:hypothetical protein
MLLLWLGKWVHAVPSSTHVKTSRDPKQRYFELGDIGSDDTSMRIDLQDISTPIFWLQLRFLVLLDVSCMTYVALESRQRHTSLLILPAF